MHLLAFCIQQGRHGSARRPAIAPSPSITRPRHAIMALRTFLLLALVGACAASAGHGVHHLTTDSFTEAVGDGKVRGAGGARQLQIAGSGSGPASWAAARPWIAPECVLPASAVPN